MSNKLVQTYNEIEAELEEIRKMLVKKADVAVIQERIAEVTTKQTKLKETVLYLIALSKLRDDAWRTLSYGQASTR
jgi:hypothetical protein